MISFGLWLYHWKLILHSPLTFSANIDADPNMLVGRSSAEKEQKKEQKKEWPRAALSVLASANFASGQSFEGQVKARLGRLRFKLRL